jgi:hypothetical protein
MITISVRKRLQKLAERLAQMLAQGRFQGTGLVEMLKKSKGFACFA